MPLWGNTDANVSKPKYLNRGQIAFVTVTDGGSGYVAAPDVTISAPNSGTQATATASIANGKVVSVNITNPGAGYTSSDTITVTFSAGAATATAIYVPVEFANSAIVFIDRTEAAISTNRDKGMRSPGWWLVKQSTDAQGSTTYNAELLVAMDRLATDAGDNDSYTGTVTIVASIVSDPDPAEVGDDEDVVFTASAVANIASDLLRYEWQTSTDGLDWDVVANETSYIYTRTCVLADDGLQVRVRIYNILSAVEDTSDAVTLAVA